MKSLVGKCQILVAMSNVKIYVLLAPERYLQYTALFGLSRIIEVKNPENPGF